jgi:hypothetical protein
VAAPVHTSIAQIVFQYPRGERATFLDFVGRQRTDGLHCLSLRLCGHRGRNVCLAILAGFHCAGCSYSHERHDVATLDDEELKPIVQQKLQEIQSWFNRTHQWFPSAEPISSVPIAFVPPPVPYGYSQPQTPYPAEFQEQPKQSTSSFANTDPSKVAEFKPKGLPGLQLLTPTSPQSRESFASAPNEDPVASAIDSAQGTAAFETTASWTVCQTNLSNGDGWITPESNLGINTEDKQPEEPTEGNESTSKFDWAEDADRTLSISPLNTTEPTSEWDWEASKQEPAPEVTEDIANGWIAEHGLSGGGSWFVGTESTASGWDDPPKVAEPTGDMCSSISPSNETWGANGANENHWNTVPSKGKQVTSVAKKEKEKPFNSPPLTPKPKYKDNRFHKGPLEKDWRGGKEEGLTRTTAWNSAKKGKKGDKPPPTHAAKPFANPSTKFGPAKEKRRDQATGPKDAFIYKRTTWPSSSATTLRSATEDQVEGPGPTPLPDLPADLKVEGYPADFITTLRQGVVPKVKVPGLPSIAAVPESTNSDVGMNWVNGKHRMELNTDTPKDFSERKVQMDETNGWHPDLVKRSKSKTSPTEEKVNDWPKLGK